MELERYGGNSKNYHDVCLDSTWRLKVTRWNLHILKPVESLSADFRSFPIIYQICPKRLHGFCILACFYSGPLRVKSKTRIFGRPQPLPSYCSDFAKIEKISESTQNGPKWREIKKKDCPHKKKDLKKKSFFKIFRKLFRIIWNVKKLTKNFSFQKKILKIF